MGAVWDNTSQDTLTVGPSANSQSIVITDQGKISGGPEIDFTNSEGDYGVLIQDSVGDMELRSYPSSNLTSPVGRLYLGAQGGTGAVSGLSSTGEVFLAALGGPLVLSATAGIQANPNAGTGPLVFVDPLNDSAGNVYRPVARGSASVTTSASGGFTVAHGLSGTPIYAAASVFSSSLNGVSIAVFAITATSVSFRASTSSGPVASTALTVLWHAEL